MTVRMEVMLAFNLKEDVPQEVVNILKNLTRKGGYDYNALQPSQFINSNPEHINYLTWWNIFQFPEYGPSLDDFGGVGVCIFEPASWNSKLYKLTIRCEIDSDDDFISAYFPFLEWIATFVDTMVGGSFVGYFRRTNSMTEHPTLIYMDEGKIFFSEIKQNPVEVNSKNLLDFL